MCATRRIEALDEMSEGPCSVVHVRTDVLKAVMPGLGKTGQNGSSGHLGPVRCSRHPLLGLPRCDRNSTPGRPGAADTDANGDTPTRGDSAMPETVHADARIARPLEDKPVHVRARTEHGREVPDLLLWSDRLWSVRKISAYAMS